MTNADTIVEDLGSKNGTRGNGEEVRRPVALREDDAIEFGSVTMTYRVADVAASTLTKRSR